MRFFYNIKCVRSGFLLGFLFALLVSGCTKKTVIGEDPYAGGKEALGIRFVGDYPIPERGAPGSHVTFQVEGLKAWENKFEFRINDELAEVVSLTDSTIRVIVPALVSTGGASIKLEGQVFFGPRFEVLGNVSIDKNFKVVNGSNATILDAASFNAGYMLVGGFTDFENQASPTKAINRISGISADGTFNQSEIFGKGADGAIVSVNRIPSNGQYIVAGSFFSFNDREGMANITRLNSNGTLDSTIQDDLINLTPNKPENGKDTVSTFNASLFKGTVAKSFISVTDKGEQITVVGSFREYGAIDYTRATRAHRPTKITSINHVLRLSIDGELDEEYNFDESGKTNIGANGNITDAHLQSDNKLVLVGSFTTFHGTSANRIVRLDNDGKVDDTFNVGMGANDVISSIVYDPISQTYLLVGAFTTFNGKPVNKIVRLHIDGSIDDSFAPLEFGGGVPNFAHQLKNGKVLISGNFLKYDNITRRGFLLLNNDGSISQEFNNVGAFEGQVFKVIETTSALGNPAVILIGYIQKFNDQKVGNILQVEIKN